MVYFLGLLLVIKAIFKIAMDILNSHKDDNVFDLDEIKVCRIFESGFKKLSGYKRH